MSLLQMSVTGGVMILAITVLRALAMNMCRKRRSWRFGARRCCAGAAGLAVLYPEHLFTAGAEDSLERGRRARSGNSGPFAGAGCRCPAADRRCTGADNLRMEHCMGLPGWFSAQPFSRRFTGNAAGSSACLFQWTMMRPGSGCKRIRCGAGSASRQSDQISSPLTFGVLHPVILMPKKTDWNDETGAAIRFGARICTHPAVRRGFQAASDRGCMCTLVQSAGLGHVCAGKPGHGVVLR